MNVNGGNLTQKPNNPVNQKVEVKNILANINMKKKFEEVLGKKAAGFMASMINLSNTTLKDVEPYSVISSAMIAATLDLPIDPNLGFAWVIPYGKKAQFQMGWKGYVQLSLRTGQYKAINVLEIYKGQLKSWNPLTEELEFDFNNKEDNEVIGYAAFFKLINGFEKTVYWDKDKVLAHAKRFSKTYNQKEDRFASYNKWKKEWIPSPWETDFNEMAKKTVLKNTLSKWGMLSIEMQTAVLTDQAVINKGILSANNADDVNSNAATNVEYEDNPETKDGNEIKDVNYTEVNENNSNDDKVVDEKGKEINPPWEENSEQTTIGGDK